MFGHKNAGLMDSVLRSPRKVAKKSDPPAAYDVVNRPQKTALDAYVRGEMYFAVSGASRWTR